MVWLRGTFSSRKSPTLTSFYYTLFHLKIGLTYFFLLLKMQDLMDEFSQDIVEKHKFQLIRNHQ